jgi:hypothetical protein
VNIGGAVVPRLLAESEALVFNLDKCGYASDLTPHWLLTNLLRQNN